MTTREALILVIDEIAELRGIALAALAESDAERSTPQNRVPPNRPIKRGRGGGARAPGRCFHCWGDKQIYNCNTRSFVQCSFCNGTGSRSPQSVAPNGAPNGSRSGGDTDSAIKKG